MEGRPRSAVRPPQPMAVVRSSTESLEPGAMVGAGQYGVAKRSAQGAASLQLPGPLLLPNQPAPLASPVAPSPGPPTATAADLRAMVMAFDESPSPVPSPGPYFSSILNPFAGVDGAAAADNAAATAATTSPSRSPGPMPLDPEPCSTPPGPGPAPRPSLTLRTDGVTLSPSAAATPSARRAADAANLSPATASAASPSVAAAAAAAGACISPRSPGWIEAVYSPQSSSLCHAGGGARSPPDSGFETRALGLGSGPEAVGEAPSASTLISPSSSPRRLQVSGCAASPAFNPPAAAPAAALWAFDDLARPTTPLQYVYGSAPSPARPAGAATADWSGMALGLGRGGGDAAAAGGVLPVKEGLRAYYAASPSASAALRRGHEGGGDGGHSGSSPASPQAASASLASASASSPVSAASQVRQPPPAAEHQLEQPRGSRPRSVAGPGPGSAALALGRSSPARGATAGSRTAVGAATMTGPGRRLHSAAAGSGLTSTPGRSQAGTAAAGGGGGGGKGGGERQRTRRAELFAEEDPAVVLDQSIALLSEIEGHIRGSVGLAPDHPLQAIGPDTAQDIPLQLVEALEDTLEVIAMAREELARLAAFRDQGRDRDRERWGDRASSAACSSSAAACSASSSSSLGLRRGSTDNVTDAGQGGGGGGGRVSRCGSQGSSSGLTGAGGGRGGWASCGSGGFGGGPAGGGAGGPGAAYGGSYLPPIGGGPGGGSGCGGTSSRGGLPLYGRPPSMRQQSTRRGPQQQPPPPPLPPQPKQLQRAGSSSSSGTFGRRNSSGSINGCGGGAAGATGAAGAASSGCGLSSVPSTLAGYVSARRAWHREAPPEEWLAAKLRAADAERRRREAQLAADLRYLRHIRGRATAVQQTHEEVLAEAEEAVRAARSAKASSEAQHRWLQYQDAVAEGARRHEELVLAQRPVGHLHA